MKEKFPTQKNREKEITLKNMENETIIMDLNAPENKNLKELIALKNKSEEIKKKIGKIDEFLSGRQRVIGTGESIKEMYVQKEKEKENLEKSLSEIESQIKNKTK